VRSLYPRATAGLLCALLAGAVLATLVACDKSSPAGPTPVCAYSLSPSEQSFPSDGGPGTLTISTDAQCAWAVEGAGAWVTLVSAASGVGPGSIRFTVQPNAGDAARQLMLTIAKMPFKVSQDGRTPCIYAITPDQKSFPKDGGSAQVGITAAAACAWTAKSEVSWITVTGGAQGLGTGNVSYSVAENNTASARTGTLRIAANTFTVEQSGENGQPANCTYSVTPTEFTPCMPAGTVTATVTTQAACTWTAAPDASWLSVPSGQSGNGSGTITITFTSNYDASRDGAIKVRWPTPTAGQNIHIGQAGCTYAVTQNAFTFTPSGGPGTFDVLQESQPNTCGGPLQNGCVWTARSTVSWITVTSSMPRTGDDSVKFTVAANGGGSRVGTITVRDKVVTITQGGL
jgi:hypothetical protein